jgi:hypothetical protein
MQKQAVTKSIKEINKEITMIKLLNKLNITTISGGAWTLCQMPDLQIRELHFITPNVKAKYLTKIKQIFLTAAAYLS